jgi:hypothetical protein
MTAVEWLMEQITYDNGFGERHNSYIDSFNLKEFFEKAKEMEKKQIIEAWIAEDNPLQRLKAEQYYNETFKNK